MCHADKTQQCDGEQLGGYFTINSPLLLGLLPREGLSVPALFLNFPEKESETEERGAELKNGLGDIEVGWEHGAWDFGRAEYSKKDNGEMKDEMERIFMGGRKPCEETGQKDFSPCTGEYATGDLYHVLMTHNKGKSATALLPVVRTILGKTYLFYMAKDDKAYYQKKGKWHKCGCQRDHEWCQHLATKNLVIHEKQLQQVNGNDNKLDGGRVENEFEYWIQQKEEGIDINNKQNSTQDQPAGIFLTSSCKANHDISNSPTNSLEAHSEVCTSLPLTPVDPNNSVKEEYLHSNQVSGPVTYLSLFPRRLTHASCLPGKLQGQGARQHTHSVQHSQHSQLHSCCPEMIALGPTYIKDTNTQITIKQAFVTVSKVIKGNDGRSGKWKCSAVIGSVATVKPVLHSLTFQGIRFSLIYQSRTQILKEAAFINDEGKTSVMFTTPFGSNSNITSYSSHSKSENFPKCTRTSIQKFVPPGKEDNSLRSKPQQVERSLEGYSKAHGSECSGVFGINYPLQDEMQDNEGVVPRMKVSYLCDRGSNNTPQGYHKSQSRLEFQIKNGSSFVIYHVKWKSKVFPKKHLKKNRGPRKEFGDGVGKGTGKVESMCILKMKKFAKDNGGSFFKETFLVKSSGISSGIPFEVNNPLLARNHMAFMEEEAFVISLERAGGRVVRNEEKGEEKTSNAKVRTVNKEGFFLLTDYIWTIKRRKAIPVVFISHKEKGLLCILEIDGSIYSLHNPSASAYCFTLACSKYCAFCIWSCVPIMVVVVEEEEDSELCYHPSHLVQEEVEEVLNESSYHHNLFWMEAWDAHSNQEAFCQNHLFPTWEIPRDIRRLLNIIPDSDESTVLTHSQSRFLYGVGNLSIPQHQIPAGAGWLQWVMATAGPLLRSGKGCGSLSNPRAKGPGAQEPPQSAFPTHSKCIPVKKHSFIQVKIQRSLRSSIAQSEVIYFILTKLRGTALLQACRAISTALSTSAEVMEGVYLDILRKQKEHVLLSNNTLCNFTSSRKSIFPEVVLIEKGPLSRKGMPETERQADVHSTISGQHLRSGFLGQEGEEGIVQRFTKLCELCYYYTFTAAATIEEQRMSP
eukprot:bmy_07925T0